MKSECTLCGWKHDGRELPMCPICHGPMEAKPEPTGAGKPSGAPAVTGRKFPPLFAMIVRVRPGTDEGAELRYASASEKSVRDQVEAFNGAFRIRNLADCAFVVRYEVARDAASSSICTKCHDHNADGPDGLCSVCRPERVSK